MLRRLARRSSLLLASVLAACILAEVAFRLAGIAYPSFFIADPHRGTALRPGASGWQRKEGVARVEINSQGLRDREHTLSKPPGTFRVAVLGDSYTYAAHVEADRAFWAVLERELASCPRFAGRAVEAINFGVSGYGTTESLLTLRDRVWSYSPDLVLLAFFAGNDVTDNFRPLARQDRPYFLLEDDRLVLDDSFLEGRAHRLRASLLGRVFYSLVDHSRLLQVVNQAKLSLQSRARQRALGKNLKEGPLGVENGIDNAVYKAPETEAWRDAWRLTERLLETMRDEVAERQADFLVAVLSTGVQVHPDRELRAAFMAAFGIEDLFYPDRRLGAFAEQAGVPMLLLAPSLRDYAEANDLLLHGFANSRLGFGHWNEHGHQRAGELLAERICSSAAPE